ncbi:MAG TPA: response regulator transcription factor [Gammaproteobacteria bacterium]|nr:response regulator transcription factor [Gammaproteobacteria bacterium]
MKFLVADDHGLIREGLKLQLQALEPDAEVFEAASFEEVNAQIAAIDEVDLLLLDLGMPGGDGMRSLSQLCNRYPEMPIVVVSGAEQREVIEKAIDLGAAGYIPKSMAMNVMMNAIRLVLSGGVYLPENLLRGTPSNDESPMARAEEAPEPLTQRQVDVLCLMCEGLANKEIARELGISPHTVKIHVAAVLKALHVDNRTQATRKADRYQLCADN